MRALCMTVYEHTRDIHILQVLERILQHNFESNGNVCEYNTCEQGGEYAIIISAEIKVTSSKT